MNVAERLKFELLSDLHLMQPADWEAYWHQAKWLKPNLIDLSRSEFVELPSNLGIPSRPSTLFAPLRYALTKLPPEFVAYASEQPDPFGWLLEHMILEQWAELSRIKKVPWISRVWLAAASQLRAELRLIYKAHGWSDTWENLRRNPKQQSAALDLFFAQLNHARGQRRTELLAIRPVGLNANSLRRLRRARNAQGKHAGVSSAEKFMVQHWLELPHGFPGLCFFSDVALHDLVETFGLASGSDGATKQIRARLGLIQAGVRRHLIEGVIDSNGRLSLVGRSLDLPYRVEGRISWGTRRLWPRI